MRLRARMIRDCVAGLGFLHSKGVMHCDVKSLNFLVDQNLNVKLSDLGEARPLRDERERGDRDKDDGGGAGRGSGSGSGSGNGDSDRGQGLPGNINWSAPEVLRACNGGADRVRESADVWSLAMVFTEVLTMAVPFDTSECHR
jgi:serine/threonine protein kinase